MKKFYISTASFLLLLCIALTAFSQTNDCGTNAGFETGDTTGWVFRYGSYGTGVCPPAAGTCPSFLFDFTNTGMVAGRHTIVSTVGTDPNSGGTVPYVPPGGGTYSFKLGNDVATGTGGTPNY